MRCIVHLTLSFHLTCRQINFNLRSKADKQQIQIFQHNIKIKWWCIGLPGSLCGNGSHNTGVELLLKVRANPYLHFKANLLLTNSFHVCYPPKCKLVKKEQNNLQTKLALKNELLGGKGKETVKVTETNIFFHIWHARNSFYGWEEACCQIAVAKVKEG